MRSLKKILFSVIIVALFIEVLLLAPEMLETSPKAEDAKADLSKLGNSADQNMTGVHLVESEGGKKDWELTAKVADGYQGKGLWELHQVKVLFYSDEATTFQVQGDFGTIDTKTKNMMVKGHAVTTSSNGYVFKSEVMNYDSKTKVLTSPTPVAMSTAKEQAGESFLLTGDRMTANVNDSHVLVSNNIRGTRKLKDGKVVKITSDDAEFSGKTNLARFIREVVIEMDGMRLQGPEATFEYEKDTNQVSHLFVKGGVRVSDIDKWATSERLRVDFLKNQMVLNGSPRVVQNNDELTGEEIVFLQNGKQVKVNNVKANLDHERGVQQ